MTPIGAVVRVLGFERVPGGFRRPGRLAPPPAPLPLRGGRHAALVLRRELAARGVRSERHRGFGQWSIGPVVPAARVALVLVDRGGEKLAATRAAKVEAEGWRAILVPRSAIEDAAKRGRLAFRVALLARAAG